ncbi:IS66 family transposase [Candidatus Neptunochlamydia vexilliferae]|nr:IS66 family transposase [Candidatus Neptunochlamydia vexilliferae]
MKPTYEELETELAETRNALKEAQEALKLALERIAKLEEQLNLNSKNSSKPPSSDKKASKKGRKKNGAKRGHPGHFRPLFALEEVDKFVNIEAKQCPNCAEEVRPTGKISVHQQVKIPEKPYIVTQYNRKQFYCPCCKKYRLPHLPKEVGLSAFGTKLSAFMGFLSGSCRLPRRVCLDVLKQGFGIKAAVGTQSNIEGRVSEALKPAYKEIEDKVRLSSKPKNIDETGWSLWGEREFVWVMSTSQESLYKIQEGRGAKYRDSLLGNTNKRSIFITDRLAIYNFKGPHQYCLAHIRRDLKRFAQRAQLDGEWGKVMLECLDKIFLLWGEYKAKKRSQRSFRHSSKRYRDEFEYGLAIAALKNAHSSSLRGFARSLLKRLKKLWVFVTREGVEPTNNQAERDLRAIVLWRKISYGSKSERGDRFRVWGA